MKKWMAMTVIGVSLAAALPAQARNVKYMLPIAAALATEDAKEKLDGSVKFLFAAPASGAAAPVASQINVHVKQKIERFGDIASCQAALVEALYQLQSNAKSGGANAVVNIVSYFKRQPVVSSTTEFECHAGSYQTHVMLKGDFVRVGD